MLSVFLTNNLLLDVIKTNKFSCEFLSKKCEKNPFAVKTSKSRKFTKLLSKYLYGGGYLNIFNFGCHLFSLTLFLWCHIVQLHFENTSSGRCCTVTPIMIENWKAKLIVKFLINATNFLLKKGSIAKIKSRSANFCL